MLVNCNIGVLVSFIAGSYLSYQTVPYIMIVLPIIFVCAFSFLPQTPQFLLKYDKLQVNYVVFFIKKLLKLKYFLRKQKNLYVFIEIVPMRQKNSVKHLNKNLKN